MGRISPPALDKKGNAMRRTLAAILPFALCLPGLASAEPEKKCNERILKGEYVLSASGFTRPPASGPGTPWVPKAIIEVIQFNGDGTLTTPHVAIANPFGDVGNIVPPVAGTPGAPGTYVVNEDCTGTVEFHDPNNVSYRIVVDPSEGHTVWMLQSNPANNVLQGSARRVR
jgi:hypothetical protein